MSQMNKMTTAANNHIGTELESDDILMLFDHVGRQLLENRHQ